MEENKKVEYITYNGFNRPALVFGVPLLLLVGLGMFALVGFFGMIILFDFFKALIIPFLVGIILFIVRAMCETDPNAMRVAKLRLKGLLKKFSQGNSIISFHSGNEFTRLKYEKYRFKKIPK